jgi:hypothetical protein
MDGGKMGWVKLLAVPTRETESNGCSRASRQGSQDHAVVER